MSITKCFIMVEEAWRYDQKNIEYNENACHTFLLCYGNFHLLQFTSNTKDTSDKKQFKRVHSDQILCCINPHAFYVKASITTLTYFTFCRRSYFSFIFVYEINNFYRRTKLCLKHCIAYEMF